MGPPGCASLFLTAEQAAEKTDEGLSHHEGREGHEVARVLNPPPHIYCVLCIAVKYFFLRALRVLRRQNF